MKLDLVKILAKYSSSGVNQPTDLELAQLLQDSLVSIRSIDDLYTFFDKHLRELRDKMTSFQLPVQREVGVKNPQPAVIVPFEGSVIDMFLRRSIFAFSQMMFEDLQRLLDSFTLYKENKEYPFKQSTMLMDYWAEDKASKIENESVKKDFHLVENELKQIQNPKYVKRHLLNSIN